MMRYLGYYNRFMMNSWMVYRCSMVDWSMM